jgi:cysteinyl-tRNA synthetase
METLKIYNSLTNKKEDFVPLKPKHVSIYVCGPTVYQDVHFGNMRPVVVFDTLRRLFLSLDYQVEFVSNITDVDDKIIVQAQLENKSETELAKYYYKRYLESTDALNALRPNHSPKVTDSIPQMVNFIDQLITKGYGYQINGDVYFRVNRVKNYGQLSKVNLEDLKIGARVEADNKKESPLDFALWKKTDQGLSFKAPWSQGRPGWHTECVVMISQHFKNQKIDIHGGGFDLKFPHHENEMAQAQACYSHQLANYWMHNGFINIENEKMAKSLGNVKLARDLISTYGGNPIRYTLLTTHYRAPLNFAKDVIESNVLEVNKLLKTLKLSAIKLQLSKHNQSLQIDDQLYQKFLAAMLDDLNTPNAISVMQDGIKQLNIATRGKDLNLEISLYNTILKMLFILGLKYDYYKLSDSDLVLFRNWNKAKLDKDFATADKYRIQLIERDLI